MGFFAHLRHSRDKTQQAADLQIPIPVDFVLNENFSANCDKNPCPGVNTAEVQSLRLDSTL
jgi:hypothetical protein